MNSYIYYAFVLKNLFQNLFGVHYPTEVIALIVLRLYKPIQIVVGEAHTILISERIYVWGQNHLGQLGLGDYDNRNSPYELPGFSRISSAHTDFVKVGDELPLSNIKSISCGPCHTIALSEYDEIYSWGNNDFGQLGLGDILNRNLPTKMIFCFGGLQPKSIVCGGYHTVVLALSSNVCYVWGYNQNGQLGLGDTITRHTPQQLILDNVESVACGLFHTIALTRDGRIYVWGWGRYGQLGLADRDDRNSPQKLSLSDIKSISCGGYHTVVSTLSGDIWSWGDNHYGQLGLGEMIGSKNIPSCVMLKTAQTNVNSEGLIHVIKSINCGRFHTAIVVSASSIGRIPDSLYVWGHNCYGQLGLGDKNDRASPQELIFPNVNNIKTVACGERHMIAITSTNDVYVWGANDSGQLGLGDGLNRNSPCQLKF